MKKRRFDNDVDHSNVVRTKIDTAELTADVLMATTGTITTLDGTTAGIDVVNASKAINISSTLTIPTLTIDTKLSIPTSPYKTSGMEYGVFYFTGHRLYSSISGAWISASLSNDG